MDQFATTYLTPEVMASVLAALAMFGTILSLTLPMLQGDKLETRLKAVTEQRERLRKQSRARLEATGSTSIRREAKGAVASITKKLNLAKLLEDDKIEMKLAQAGMRGPKPLSTYYFFRLVMPFVGAAAAFGYIFFVNDFGLAPMQKYASILFGAGVGFYAPSLYVTQMLQKRQASIMKAFPDALDMMLICVEAGMSIEMAFSKVGGEIGSASPELAEELTLTTAELAYLPERRMAYENLAARTGHDGVKSVCMALLQGERYGTPLGDALRVMARENRDMRMSEAEKKAASLPAKLTVPMIVFFLPVLFLVVLGPAYIKFQEMG